jgi:malate dehydrogenase
MGIKVTIVGGAGTVGSCAAFRLAQDGLASEIVLLDARRNMAQAHAYDIDQAMVHRNTTAVRAGDIEDTKDSDLIIVAVAVFGRPPLLSRSLSLEENLKLVMELMPPLVAQSPSAFWFFISAPVDVLVYLMHRLFSIPRHRIIGLNRNDTTRLRWAIGRTLSVPGPKVEAFMLGEHGETQVPVLSHVRVDGKEVKLTADQKREIKSKVDEFLPKWVNLQAGRTAGWTTAESIGDVARTFATDDGAVWACSMPLEGEYGLSDVGLGVPVRLGRQGIKEIIQLDLDPAEKEALETSARTIKSQIQQAEVFLDHSMIAYDNLLILLEGGKRS